MKSMLDIILEKIERRESAPQYKPPPSVINPTPCGGSLTVMSDKDEITPVYHIKQNRNGYPMFLIYDKNQWRYVSAKHFKPV